jgi:mRNA interferase YafQ
MLKQLYTTQFKKDVVRAISRGKDLQKLEILINFLTENIKPLPLKYKNHSLVGNFKGRRDCHIEPDWILIYRKEGNTIIFERTGTHSDLFKK